MGELACQATGIKIAYQTPRDWKKKRSERAQYVNYCTQLPQCRCFINPSGQFLFTINMYTLLTSDIPRTDVISVAHVTCLLFRGSGCAIKKIIIKKKKTKISI